jgi:oxygen-independent coproporphyrinogen III oxidase
MNAAPFALYVHFPWCRHVCPYCDFNVYAAQAPPADGYVAAATAELAAHARDASWAGRRVQSVYLGGGTPSLLPPAAVGALLDDVARRFGIVAGAEVTLEANPGTVSRAQLAGYRGAGVSRLSLGAQSFHAPLLRTLGRDHAPGDTAAALDAARAAGIDDVSVDLIFAVPGETPAEWEADLEAAIALAPTHVSTYALTYEERTPFHAWRARGRLAPVADDDEAAMAEAAAVRLPAAGYARYEISSYARPGFASRHNVAYWNGSDYLGVGPGAHSFSGAPAPGRRWWNERGPAEWAARTARDGLAVAGEERLTAAQARGEFCFTGLRQIAGIDVGGFERRFALPLDAAFPHVARLVDEGLVERTPAAVRLTARGLRFADAVAATFV